MKRVGYLSAICGLAIAGVACGGDGSAETATSSPATMTTGDTPAVSGSPSSSTSTEVVSDVRFAEQSPDLAPWSDALLDVYSPPGADSSPLVVVLPPHSLDKDNASSVQLANGLAERGAVVVVANWSQHDDPPETFEDPAVLSEIARAGQSLVACAVSFARSKASEYGADPSRLVLVGELIGANTASMVALGNADPYPSCLAPATAGNVAALVGLNADWLALAPFFDTVATTAAEVLSPWTLLDDAPTIPTMLVVTPDTVSITARCGDRDVEWMESRDPTGAMRDQLDAVDAYEDGCVDFGAEAEAMAAQMVAQGLPAEVVWLGNADAATRSGPGGQVVEFGQADLNLLIDTIIAASQTPNS